jgi:hypothetical protein
MTDEAVIFSFDEQVQWYTPKGSEDLWNAQSLANTCRRFRTLYSTYANLKIPIVHNLSALGDLSRWYERHSYVKPIPERTNDGMFGNPNRATLNIETIEVKGDHYATFYEISAAAALRQHRKDTPAHGWCSECADIFGNATIVQNDMIFVQAPRGNPCAFHVRIRKQCLLEGVVHARGPGLPMWIMSVESTPVALAHKILRSMCKARPPALREAPKTSQMSSQRRIPRTWVYQ